MMLSPTSVRAEAVYEFTNLNTDERIRAGGRERADRGLPVQLRNRPQAALLTYRQFSKEK